jgi:hypothetical protein
LVHHGSPRWFRSRVEAGEWNEAAMSAVSGADGAFVLPRHGDGVISVSASHDDYVPEAEWTTCAAGEHPVVVMFRTHTVPLVVEVVDENTGVAPPVFECSATTFWTVGGTDDGVNRSLAEPDKVRCTDGRFEGTARFVEGLPLQVRAYTPGVGFAHWQQKGDQNWFRELHPEPGQPIRLRFELDIGGAERVATDGLVVGRVADADGEPVAGASVCISRADKGWWVRYVQSWHDGRFRIARPRDLATGAIEIEHPDYQTVRIDEPADDVGTIRLVPRGSLRCRIVDGAGLPLAGVPFLARTRGRGFHQRGRTDDDGELFFAGLLEDRYYVYVLRRPHDADEQALTSDGWRVGAGEQLDVELSVAPPDRVRVMGSITGQTAEVVPVFVPHRDGGFVQGRRRGSGYDAGGLARGDYLVGIAGEDDGAGIQPALLPRVTVSGFGTQVIDLHVPNGELSGWLIVDLLDLTADDRDQLRVVAVPDVPPGGAAAELVASAKFTEAFGTKPDAGGRFVLTSLPPGPCTLQLRSSDRVLAERRVDVDGVVDIGAWQPSR